MKMSMLDDIEVINGLMEYGINYVEDLLNVWKLYPPTQYDREVLRNNLILYFAGQLTENPESWIHHIKSNPSSNLSYYILTDYNLQDEAILQWEGNVASLINIIIYLGDNKSKIIMESILRSVQDINLFSANLIFDGGDDPTKGIFISLVQVCRDDNDHLRLWTHMSKYTAITDKFIVWAGKFLNLSRIRQDPNVSIDDFFSGIDPHINFNLLHFLLWLEKRLRLEGHDINIDWLSTTECPLNWSSKKDNIAHEVALYNKVMLTTIHALNIGYFPGFSYIRKLEHILYYINVPHNEISDINRRITYIKKTLAKMIIDVDEFYVHMADWITENPQIVPDALINSIALIYEAYAECLFSTYPFEVSDRIVDLYSWSIWCPELSINYRGLMLLSLNLICKNGLMKYTHPSVISQLPKCLVVFYNDLIFEKNINRWIYTPAVYNHLQNMLTSADVNKYIISINELFDTRHRLPLRFFNSLFSDVIVICEELASHFKSLSQSSDLFMTLTTHENTDKYLSILNSQMIFINTIINSPIKNLYDILHSPEVIGRLAGSLIHTLNILLTNSYHTIGRFVFENKMIVPVVEKLFDIIHTLRIDKIVVKEMIRHVDYSYDLMIQAFTTMQSLLIKKGNDEVIIKIAETVSILDTLHAETQKEDATTTVVLDEIEFLDPILYCNIVNPVVIPTSKPLICDLDSISEWLLTHNEDPFNKQSLLFQDVDEYNKTDVAKEIVANFLKKRDEFRSKVSSS